MKGPGLTDDTVLYVEDEETDVLLMRRAFQRSAPSSSLHVVADGQAAINYLSGEGGYRDREKHPVPKLVLLDLNLPIVSGFEILKWMRDRGTCEKIPVVVFSSSSREQDKTKARALGADDYVEKPTSAVLFSDVVRSLRERWLTGHD